MVPTSLNEELLRSIAAAARMHQACSPRIDVRYAHADGEEHVKYLPQRELLRPVWDAMHLALITSSTALDIASVGEASSPVGRTWLRQLPVNQGLNITNKSFVVMIDSDKWCLLTLTVFYCNVCIRALCRVTTRQTQPAKHSRMNVDPIRTEPATNGQIKLRTSLGDVIISLWSKEAPLACRNLIQLALEGYYDDQIFHRIVSGFIVQTGDPTGTGTGGTSIYSTSDNPTGGFRDELHHRIHPNKRGLVAMANAGRPNSNESQFFITLAPTPELAGKHTIFGKVEGAGIYTILEISEVELVDVESGRPKHPPKLLGIDVLLNPFDDINPRTTSAERAKQKERLRIEKEQAKEKKRRTQLESEGNSLKKTKNAKLLSFGDDEEFEAMPSSSKHETKLNRKVMSSVDALAGPTSSIPVETAVAPTEPMPEVARNGKGKATEGQVVNQSLADLRSDHEAGSSRASANDRIKALEASIRSSAKRSASPEEERRKRNKTTSAGSTWLQEQRALYQKDKKAKKGKGRGDDDVLARLSAFKAKLDHSKSSQTDAAADERRPQQRQQLEADEPVFPEMREYGMLDEEDDDEIAGHKFEVVQRADGADSKDRFSVNDYEVIDPRSEAAIRMGFGGDAAAKRLEEKKKKRNEHQGRAGRDYVDTSDRRYADAKRPGRPSGERNHTAARHSGDTRHRSDQRW